MLNFIPAAIERLPKNVIAYDWYYYPFSRHPKVELFNFAESDLASLLRKRGIEYWGCAMNGAFRYEPLPLFKDRMENIRSWWKRCRAVGAGGMLITSWEAYRLALPMTTVVDAAAASLWLNRSSAGEREMLTDGFSRVFGKETAKRSAQIALAADMYPFAGYARWEINERWDVSPFKDAGARSAAKTESAFFGRLRRKSTGLPVALAASISFRSYLARRDAFVVAAAHDVWLLRRALNDGGRQPDKVLASMQRAAAAFAGELREGRKAANVMWRLTRNPDVSGHNIQILAKDVARLTRWRRWLRDCARKPRLVFEETPVCGVWQLFFVVVNFAPALQRVAVEQAQPNGQWSELHGRYTIEFQAVAARPRARVRRIFSVPIDDPAKPLRLVLRGLGEVRIENVVVDNGLQRFRLSDRRSFTLGRPAPRDGFPDIGERLDEKTLRFVG